MKLVETKDLRGRALDWAIAKILKRDDLALQIIDRPGSYMFRPSSDWSYCGPLIPTFKVNLQEHSIESLGWLASIYPNEFEPVQARDASAPTAICLAIATKEYGASVRIPRELLTEMEVANG